MLSAVPRQSAGRLPLLPARCQQPGPSFPPGPNPMRRADRLFQIIQILRRARAPLTGEAIATELECSTRTLYRDIAELMAQRVPIRGEAGLGYVLEGGYDKPPLDRKSTRLNSSH